MNRRCSLAFLELALFGGWFRAHLGFPRVVRVPWGCPGCVVFYGFSPLFCGGFSGTPAGNHLFGGFPQFETNPGEPAGFPPWRGMEALLVEKWDISS